MIQQQDHQVLPVHLQVVRQDPVRRQLHQIIVVAQQVEKAPVLLAAPVTQDQVLLLVTIRVVPDVHRVLLPLQHE